MSKTKVFLSITIFISSLSVNLNAIGWIKNNVNVNYANASSIYACDIDGDGDIDILGTAAGTTDEVTWWENTDGTGTSWTERNIASGFDSAISVYAADIDGDGDPDVVAAADFDGDVHWWENMDGTGTNWTEHTIDNFFNGASGVYACDMDGDGDIDVLGAADTADDIVWWENTDGTGTSWLQHNVDTSFERATSVYAVDIDGDGDLDVLGAGRAVGAGVAWWENANGTGTSWTYRGGSTNRDGACSVHACDIDGDGDSDYIYAAENDDIIRLRRNNGGGWADTGIASGLNGACSVYGCDVDGDGDMDVLGAASGIGAGMFWYENVDGLGSSWTPHTIESPFNGAASIYGCDVNGDGAMDILGAAGNADDIAWWESDTNGCSLAWSTNAGYTHLDGVDPNPANADDTLTFEIRFQNYQDTAPATAQVWIDFNNDEDYDDAGEKLDMSFAGGNFTDALFTYSLNDYGLIGDGYISYKFYFINSTGHYAGGTPAADGHYFSVINDFAAPYLQNLNPSSGAIINNDDDGNIMFTIFDSTGVDPGSIVIRIDSQNGTNIAYSNSGFLNGYTGTLSVTNRSDCGGSADVYSFDINPGANTHPYNRQVTVWVDAHDISANSNSMSTSYSFTSSLPPAVPGDFAGSGIATNQVQYSWSATANASGYAVCDESSNIISPWYSGGNTWTESGLDPNLRYQRLICVTNNTGISYTAPGWTTYTYAMAPLADANTALDTSSISVSWQHNGNPVDTMYFVSNTLTADTSGWLTGTLWTNTGLNNCVQYSYRIMARNKDLTTSAWVNLGSKYTIPNIAGLPTISTQTTVSLRINIETNFNPPTAEYAVYNQTAGQWVNSLSGNLTGTASWGTYAQWGGDTGRINTGLAVDTAYQYYVIARNPDGDTNAAGPVSPAKYTLAASPSAAPVSIDITSTSIEISWTASASTYYVVQRCGDNAGAPDNAWIDLVNESSHFTDTNYNNISLPPSTIFYYRVAGVNGDDIRSTSYSPYVQISTAAPITLPAPPDNFQAVTVTTTSILWNWRDNAVDEDNYDVQNQFNTPISGDLPANTTNWDETGLTPNTAYTRHAAAKNGGGQTNSQDVTVYTMSLPPPSLDFTLSNSATNILSWGAVSALRFRVERSIDDMSNFVLLDDNVSGTSYTDITILPVTTYYYRVYSYNGDGIMQTVASPTAGETAPPDGSAPLTPGGLSVESGLEELSVSWNPNAETDLAFYVLYYATTSGGPYASNIISNAVQYTLTGLDLSSMYYVSIAAVDTSGNQSPLSAEIAASPLGVEGNNDAAINRSMIRDEDDYIKIDFNYPDSTSVEVRIYTVTGKLVRSYMDIVETVGSVTWDGKTDEDGTDVANGLYFIMVKAGDTEKVIKVGVQK